MRRLLISLLLASAAASPVAAQHNWSGRQQAQDDRQSAREERQSAREERAQSREELRSDRSDNRASFNERQVEQRAQVPQVDRAGRAQQMEARQQGFAGGDASRYYARPDRGNAERQVQGNDAPAYVGPGARVVTPRETFDQRRQDRQDARELRQSSRPIPNVMRDRNPLVVSNTPRPGTQPPLRTEGYRNHQQDHWNTSWRNDNRYDWHNYRNHHRSHFHLGFYYDPYGWGYQPFSIGWRLWPGYYSSNFWINDPWSYRLPYAPPGYVWVRYWNDALLVDTWTGTVVDMIPGFFW